ncbi:hypothetical protein ACFWE4_36150, partial [Streptomyces sp. NPDC060187]
MPDEAQPLAPSAERLGGTASTKPEPASGPVEKPAENAASGPVEHAQSAPDDTAAEQPRPKPAPPERAENTPAVRPAAGQPARTGGSSNRVRARLARLGVQRSNPYNPVLEPRGGPGGRNQPPKKTGTPRPLEKANPGAPRRPPRPNPQSGGRA